MLFLSSHSTSKVNLLSNKSWKITKYEETLPKTRNMLSINNHKNILILFVMNI